jgi:hypothetical protein
MGKGMRETEIKDDSQVFSLNSWKDGITIYEDEEDLEVEWG